MLADALALVTVNHLTVSASRTYYPPITPKFYDTP